MTNIDTILDIQDLIDRAKSLGMLGWRKAQIALTCGINKGDKACADHDQSCMGGCPFWKDQAPTIDPDAIRMNCACRAGLYIESVHELDGYHIDPDMLELAILGKEAEK